MIISVIIPSFNRFSFLLQAVSSVLHQKNIQDIHLEIIIIDDCSTDPKYLTLSDEIQKLQNVLQTNHTVVVIRNDVNFRTKFNSNHAQGLTRNEGLKVCKGTWIGFLDDDDFWLPTKLSKQLQALNNQKSFDRSKESSSFDLMCSTNAIIGYGLAKTGSYNQIYFKQRLGNTIDNEISSFDLEYIKGCNYIMNSSVLMHRSLLDLAGYQKAEVYEDYEYWKRCLQHTSCLYLCEPLIGYDMGHGYGKQYSNN